MGLEENPSIARGPSVHGSIIDRALPLSASVCSEISPNPARPAQRMIFSGTNGPALKSDGRGGGSRPIDFTCPSPSKGLRWP